MSTEFKTAASQNTPEGNAERTACIIYARKHLAVMNPYSPYHHISLSFFQPTIQCGRPIMKVSTMFYSMKASMSCFTIHNMIEFQSRLAD